MNDITLTFNISWLFKVFTITIVLSKKNQKLFDFASDVYVYNNRIIFLNFVKKTTALSRVIAQKASLEWKIVIWLLAQKDNQLRSQ